ncbi:MAG TPA: ABC transporter permease, partial [Clostridia bacterium]|nr:ABC transporter permease [Clostridia bacterium]
MVSSKQEYSLEHQYYLKRIKRQKALVIALRYILLIGIFVLWEVAARQGWIDAFITSSPSRVLKTIISLYKSKSLFVHIWVTFYETVVGFLLGTFLGTSIAIMLWWSPIANKVLDPYLVVLNALPKIALGPILIVWIGATSGSIIAMG